MSGKNATEVCLPDEAGIAKAAAILRDGGLVALPTETVYGLAARADCAEAVARIYAAKGRPALNPLIIHVRDMAQAETIAEFSADALAVADMVWPGPLTLVLPRRRDARLADAVTAGLATVALRMPAHPVMQAVLEQCDFPLAAPSANRSNAISPTSAAHVLTTLDGRINLVLDGGASPKGLESSILAIRHDASWEELRSGPVDCDLLHRYLHGTPMPQAGFSGIVEAPGQLARHYSPGKPLRLDADSAEEEEFWIGFGPVAGDMNLSASGDLGEAAAGLYAALHQAAGSPKPRIAVAPIPEEAIGKAINDRLRRAAA